MHSQWCDFNQNLENVSLPSDLQQLAFGYVFQPKSGQCEFPARGSGSHGVFSSLPVLVFASVSELLFCLLVGYHLRRFVVVVYSCRLSVSCFSAVLFRGHAVFEHCVYETSKLILGFPGALCDPLGM